MKINLDRIDELNKLIISEKNKKLTILLGENNQACVIKGNISNAIIKFDVDTWDLSKEDEEEVERIANENMSSEEKLLEMYKSVCERYTYDDNTLSYVTRNYDDTFELPDEYGRQTDDVWKQNRSMHSRRNCFEVSRILAKSLRCLFEKTDENEKNDVCVLWDEENVHYLVGLASDDYALMLDTDDFNQIKDLTRIKTGLTLEGIEILKDKDDKFKNVLNRYNQDRYKTTGESIEDKFDDEEKSSDSYSMKYLECVVRILKNDYNLDAAGMFEYMKEVVDVTFGPTARKKLWKKVDRNDQADIRTRCLYVQLPDTEKGCLIDVTKENPTEICRICTTEEIGSEFISYKSGIREWDDYDGR